MQKFWRTIRPTVFALLFVALFAVPSYAFGTSAPLESTNFGLTNVDTSIALSNDRSVIDIISNIINIMLGLLGIIVLGLILYAGFLWMTANGNDEKIATAKKILTNAVIGLAIILSAYTITYFIFRSLSNATGSGNVEGVDTTTTVTSCQTEGGCDTTLCPNYGFSTVCPEQSFFVKSITPSTNDADTNDATFMNNAVVRVVFSQPIAAGDIEGAVKVVYEGEKVEMTAVGTERNTVIELIPVEAFKTGLYSVVIANNIKDYTGASLESEDVRGNTYPAETEFFINKLINDDHAPEVLSLLVNGETSGEPLYIGNALDVSFIVSDRETIPDGLTDLQGGIGMVIIEIKDGSRSVYRHVTGPKVYDQGNFGSSAVFTDSYIQPILSGDFPTGRMYTVIMTVHDIDGNTAEERISFPIYPASCGNGVLDPGEEDIDTGGVCGLDAGAACRIDSDCSPYMQCIDAACTANPIILDFDPKNAGPDNWVTIFGRFFGDEPQRIEFGYPNGGEYVWLPATAPDSNLCPAGDLWHPTWTIVTVPTELPKIDGIAIRLIKAGQPDIIESTLDDRGTTASFHQDESERPGLCAVQNLEDGGASAAPRDAVQVLGRGFETDISQISWGVLPGRITNLRSPLLLESIVPESLGRGVVGVRVQNGELSSNGIPFTVETIDQSSLPTIAFIDPATTTEQSYVTLFGSGFGAPYGTVHIAPTTDEAIACADGTAGINTDCYRLKTELPSNCGVTWHGNEVVVQVAAADGSTIAAGEYAVVLTTIGGARTSGLDAIEVVDGAAAPSICALTPNSGPAPLAGERTVRIIGTNFGTNGTVRFWNDGLNTGSVIGWLTADRGDADTRNDDTEITSYTDTLIETNFPVNDSDGLSIPTGAPVPLRVQDASGAVSNAITYTVNECTPATAPAGTQCCQTGPNAGQLMPAEFVCPGNTRSAGYTWRISSGIIPAIPRVLEQCRPATTLDTGAVPPSPAPSTIWNSGASACVNALVTVSFSLAMDASQISENSVRMYECSAQRRGCDRDTNLAAGIGSSDLVGDTILHIYDGASTELKPDTWYTIELTTALRSLDISTIAGREDVRQYQPLQETRSCGNGTAYCYDFKTSAFGDRCELIDAYVIPARKTITELGPVLDLLGTQTYFQVLGETNMECIPMSTRGLGWDWHVDNDIDTVIANDLEDDIPIMIDQVQPAWDDIRTLIANQEVPAQPLELTATLERGDDTISGTSSIAIAIGDPEVRTFWPNCSAACTDATFGVAFNRNMMQDTFTTDHVRVYNCGTDRRCTGRELLTPISIAIPDEFKHDRGFEIIPAVPLERDSWYSVQLSSGIVAIGGYAINGDVIAGDAIEAFEWGFKTKESFDGCFVADVALDPAAHVARIVGERTLFNALPYGAPDECSPYGQRLNPYNFDWDWEIPTAADQSVAVLTTSSIATANAPGCSGNCTPAGSDRTRSESLGNAYICGNGTVDPGETCDIAIPGEVAGSGSDSYTCSYSCERPGNSLVGTGAAACGNGVVDNPKNNETAAGESCDAGDQNGVPGSGCSSVCTFTGSTEVFSGDLNAPYCSVHEGVLDGILDEGESCEINRSGDLLYRGFDGGDIFTVSGLSDQQAYCNNNCQSSGTELSDAWCDEGDRRSSVLECQRAVSICGNGILESGESCEILDTSGSRPTTTIRVTTNDRLNPNAYEDIVVDIGEATRVCTPACLLGSICDYEDVFVSTPVESVWCDPSQDGCTDSCTLAGSSLAYSVLSQCRDDVVGAGEYAICEVSPSEHQLSSPVQIATAIGESSTVDETTLSQSTEIHVTTAGFVSTDEDGSTIVVPVATTDQITATSSYHLQCGFTEYETPSTIETADGTVLEYNGCPNAANGYEEGVATNSCCYDRPESSSTYPSLPTSGDRVNICRNTLLEVSFSNTVIEKGSVEGNIVLAKQIEFTAEDLAGAATTPLPSCADEGLQDITAAVEGTLSTGVEEVVLAGNFVQRTWQRVRGWIASLVDHVFAAGDTINIVAEGVWCDSGIPVEVDVLYRPDTSGSGSSTIRITPKALLDADTVYAVLARSGAEGVTDDAGVSIKPAQNTTVYDGFAIRTGDEICKITEIEVTPSTYVFGSPSDYADFVIESRTARGDRIVPIEGVYDWTYIWAPQTSDLFVIPVTAEDIPPVSSDATVYQSDYAVASLASRDIEAQQTAQGRVIITTDTATDSGDQTGKIFTDTADLYARFCANIWGGNESDEAWAPYHNDRFNFEFWYCADARSPRLITDDLPLLTLPPLNIPTTRIIGQESRTSDGRCTSGPADRMGELCSDDSECSNYSERTVPNSCDLSIDPVQLSVCVNGENDGSVCTAYSDCAELDVVSDASCVAIARENIGMCGDFAGSIGTSVTYCSSDAHCNKQQRCIETNFPTPTKIGNCEGTDILCVSGSLCPDTVSAIGQAGICSVFESLDNSEIVTVDQIERSLFFTESEDNADAFGVQVFLNPYKQSPREWFADRFGNAPTDYQSTSIDGYDAITNGTSYYVSALNVEYGVGPFNTQVVNNIYNNIYQFSINESASQDAKDMFAQIIANLKFNTNLSDHGYCLADTQPTTRRNLTEAFVDTEQCRTDFDCRTPDGIAITGTNGVCSNNRTALLRDIERLKDISTMQQSLDRVAENNVRRLYPELDSGTFYPGYTVSRWGSWGKLAEAIGGAPTDPINEWTACGDLSSTDQQTCWTADDSLYHCPAFSSVYEYEVLNNGTEYVLHAPLEFLDVDDAVVSGGTTEEGLLYDGTSFTVSPWCVGEPRNPFATSTASSCGDGIRQAGEECDTPLERITQACDEGLQAQTCSAECTLEDATWDSITCVSQFECGNGVVEEGEDCDAGGLNGQYGSGCTLDCQIIGAPYCGNGELDRGADGSYLEFCDEDEVSGVCKYLTDGGTAIAPAQVYIMLDRSGSMNTRLGSSSFTQWEQATAGLDIIARDLTDSVEFGLSVFSEVTDGCSSPQELLDMQSHTEIGFKASYAPIGPGSWTPTDVALEYVLENRLNIFDSSEESASFLILITDGKPECFEDLSPVADREENIAARLQRTVDAAGALRAEDIPVYVIGFGDLDAELQANLDAIAGAGGTNNVQTPEHLFYTADNAAGLVTQFEDILGCSTYNSFERGSCSSSCLGHGDYCGDGIVQSSFEQCDDGNVLTGDGCNPACQIEVPVVTIASTTDAGTCGDGEVQVPNNDGQVEECDLGVGEFGNGYRPDAIYGDRQTFCSSDCRTLTVDEAGFCGDGIVQDEEVCDVTIDGSETVLDTNGVAIACSDRGTIQCLASCQEVSSAGCVSCDVHYPLANAISRDRNTLMDGQPTLDLRFVNMIDTMGVNPLFDPSFILIDDATITAETGIADVSGLRNTLVDVNPTYIDRVQTDFALVSNAQCNDTYEFEFDDRVATSDDDVIINRGASLLNNFKIPVNNERSSIEVSYLVAPPLPEDTIRIVVRHEATPAGTAFFGNLYAYDQSPQIITARNLGTSDICNNSETDATTGYIVPDPTCAVFDGVYVHGAVQDSITRGVWTGGQAMTVSLDDIRSGEDRIAYYVSLVPGTMAAWQDSNSVFVDIYVHHPGQAVSQPHRPLYTFELNQANRSRNDSAGYWHVFNLVADATDIFAIEELTPSVDNPAFIAEVGERRRLPLSTTLFDSNVEHHGNVETRECTIREIADSQPREHYCTI